MENNKIYSYYKNYIKIDGREFLWEDISVSSGKRLSVETINGLKQPVIQYLGEKETTISFTIKYGGIYKASNKNGIKNKNELRDSFIDQKNFIQALIEKRTIIKLELPDGDIIYGILQDRNKNYFSLGLNRENLVLIVYKEQVEYTNIPNKNKLNVLKEKIKANLKDGIKNYDALKKVTQNQSWASSIMKAWNSLKGSVPLSWWDKIKNSVMTYSTKIDNTLKSIENVLNDTVSFVDDATNVLQVLNNISDTLISIANTPSKFVDAFDNFSKAWTYSVIKAENVLTAFKDMFVTDPQKKQEAENLRELAQKQKDEEEQEKFNNINQVQEKIVDINIDNTKNILLFTNASIVSTEIEFETDEDVANTLYILNQMYETLENNTTINEEVKSLLLTFYLETKKILVNSSTNVKNIKKINIPYEMSLLEIVYQLYGDETYYDDILLLNKDKIVNVLKVSGEIKVFDV